MNAEPSAVLAIDQWLSKSPELTPQTQIDDLGYRQLNDLLLLNHFPHLAETTDRPLGKQLSHYQRSLNSDLIASIDFAAYKGQTAKNLRRLPSFSELRSLSGCEAQVLSHDLAYITYTLERWGQFSEHKAVGETSRSFLIEHLGNLSLYEYLTTICPRFNTIETFALSFADEIERFDLATNNLSHRKRTYGFNSPFNSQEETRNKTRYPSELPVGSFHLFIKKCELVAQCYNDLILEFFELQSNELDPSAASSIHIIDQIIDLVRFSQHLMLEFLRDDSFDEEKFAYILRQITVETNLGPFNVLFDNVDLPPEHRIGVKGLTNHFLKMPTFKELELEVFLADLSHLLGGLNFYSIEEKEQLIEEVSANQGIGPMRYQFTLEIIWHKFGLKKCDLDRLVNDKDSMDRNIERLNDLSYEYAPSGANSLAFFGLDVLSGTADTEPNYLAHILNRLGVMTEFDNTAFWRFHGFMKRGLPDRIRSSITRAIYPIEAHAYPSPPEHVVHYFVLFEEISRLSSIHQGMVNRFLVKFSSRMRTKDKHSLTSSLEHGTTFMSPDRLVIPDCDAVQLPSLGSLSDKRRSHYLKGQLDDFLKAPIVRKKVEQLRHIDPKPYEDSFS